jgi:molybdopterin-containing oxidoreductase family iron-sulfur binding subunit
VGDWNDFKSVVYSSSKNDRSYQALEEIGVKPNVWYKVKVRNEDNELLSSLQKEKPVAHHEEKKAHH